SRRFFTQNFVAWRSTDYAAPQKYARLDATGHGCTPEDGMRRKIRLATRYTIRLVATALAAAVLAAPLASAAERAHLLLVFAADVSRSVDQPKFQLQRDGYAAAITNARVLEAIRSGPNHRIAVCFVEWSGAGAQKVLIDWTLISDAASAQQ